MADEATIASEMPRTSRFGMRLVNSDPGPIVITSAFAMASRVCGIGPTSGGTRKSSRIRPLLAVIFVSPRTRVPSSMSASSSRIDVAAGQKNFRGKTYGLRKVRSKRGQGCQKEIAEAVAFEAGTFVEAVTE